MIHYITPDWPAPSHVKAVFTTRHNGYSGGAYASLNLGMHVHDNPDNVVKNRTLLREHLPDEPQWLQQIHGTGYVWVKHNDGAQRKSITADAALSREVNTVCAVMVADCLPVFLCDTVGTIVGVIHAGWRGLAAGIIEQTIAAMQINHDTLMAWLGPAIGPEYFEVGDEVRTEFVMLDRRATEAFIPVRDTEKRSEPKWFADIFLLARQRLIQAGVTQIYGGGICTYSDPERFFSYRRDGETGRMAALVWMEKPHNNY